MVQENFIKRKILIICGPTASGKTALSVECAKKLNSEIISADSMNVYKELDIGTAKPTDADKKGVEHHLIDVVDKFGTFSVGDYRDIARPIIDRLLNNGKVPVVCGGTGFYINSIIYNLSYGEGSGDIELRKHYKNLAEKNGNLFVYDILKEKDPVTASKLHFNDIKRVIRALEICHNGTLKSAIKDEIAPVYDYDAYMIKIDRSMLYDRIDRRVDLMIKAGLVDEVNTLIKSGVTIENQCMQGIGYKEIYSYLSGKISLEEAINAIKLNTHHYAKRQITFFKKLPNLKTIEYTDLETMSQRIIDNL